MELEHTFEVPVGIDLAWTSLLDMELVAACFPGASLSSSKGEEYVGSVRVKLGPVQLTYNGTARIVEKDDAAHRALIEASGNATRSSSTANMVIRATVSAVSEDRSLVQLFTDLNITGRPAQFGRGVMAEVGNKLIGQFADCLSGKLATSGDTSAAPEERGDEAGASALRADMAAPGNSVEGSAAKPRQERGISTNSRRNDADRWRGSEVSRHSKVSGGPPEPMNLLKFTGLPVLKRLLPFAGATLALWLVCRKLHRSAQN